MEQTTKYVIKHDGYMTPAQLESYVSEMVNKATTSFANPVVMRLEMHGKSEPDALITVLVIVVGEEN